MVDIRIYVFAYFLKPTECTAPRVKPNVSYRLWIIMMYQCRFINCKNLRHWWRMLMMPPLSIEIRVTGSGEGKQTRAARLAM